MRIGDPLLPMDMPPGLRLALTDTLRRIIAAVNALDPTIGTTPPTSGSWIAGAFVRNTAPTIQGAAGSRYIVTGWTRVTSGSGNVMGTDWVETRCATGA